ncbi:MAG: replication restart helicase PriA [Fimbriimonas sp.]
MPAARVADVALDPRSGGAEALYTYRVDTPLAVGEAVFVPLGNRNALGFVTAVYDATEEELGFPFSGLKPVTGRVEGLALPPAVVDLCRFVAEETLCPLPVAMGAATPPGVRDRLVTAWTRVEGAQPDALTPLQQEVLRVMGEQDGTILEQKGKKLPASTTRALRLLRGKGLVTQSLRVAPFAERRSVEPMLRLTPDAERVEGFLKREGRRRPAQALTLMRLQGSTQAQLTSAEVRALAGVTETTVKALVEAGLLERVDEHAPLLRRPPIPNPAQQLAIDAIVESVRARESSAFLLFGITGSGKTEVYLRAATEALREGRQVLFLVPEIALAAQTLARLRERFGRGVAVLHSDLPPTERLRNWMRIRDGQASVVLGARSALFAPMANLGLVVVDEEHEASYKQESTPRYHTKPLARYLGQRHGCPVVFGSATPSVESFFEAEESELPEAQRTRKSGPSPLTLLTLPERAASARLPEVMIHDLTDGYRNGKPAMLCEPLHIAIEETLARGEQVILFLNRRAYAPFVICRDCGQQMQCPNCAVSLSYHRRDRKLRCHHCGYQTPPPDACPKCGGLRLTPFGVGTEKVEEAVAALFPDTRVARLDRDVARRKGALEETLASFRAGQIGILVGTQMVAKGLDFPNVTLVGVIAADVSLNIPDFRASERTFQLLAQVAGRAGRGQTPGRVFIQTFNPMHAAVRSAQTHDFLAMLEALKVERREAGYPPFRRLVNIVLSGENRPAVLKASEEAAGRLARLNAELLGPVDCAVERLQNKWRRHLLLKLPEGASAAPIGEALLGFDPKGVQVVVDVDPYNLM